VFAYGQSGSGKTHTMLGDLPREADSALPEQAGLVPRMFVRLFERIRAAEAEPREGRALAFLCRMSCLEIHQEVLTDLLAPERPRLQVRRLATGPDAGQLPAPGFGTMPLLHRSVLHYKTSDPMHHAGELANCQ